MTANIYCVILVGLIIYGFKRKCEKCIQMIPLLVAQFRRYWYCEENMASHESGSLIPCCPFRRSSARADVRRLLPFAQRTRLCARRVGADFRNATVALWSRPISRGPLPSAAHFQDAERLY